MQVEQDFLKKMKFKLVKMSALAMCRKLAVMEERNKRPAKLQQWFPNLSTSGLTRGLVKTQISGPHPGVFESLGLGSN